MEWNGDRDREMQNLEVLHKNALVWTCYLNVLVKLFSDLADRSLIQQKARLFYYRIDANFVKRPQAFLLIEDSYLASQWHDSFMA